MPELNIGIYEIVNKITNKRYVGSAARSFSKRWNLHVCELKHNRHHSCHLQNAWNKYGAENFEFNILEKVEDKTKCTEREQHWIDFHNAANDEYGYNICPKASSRLGCVTSDETKKKLRESCLGKTRSKESKQKMSKNNEKYTYKIITPDNEEIIITNLKQFCKEHKLSQGNMWEVTKNKRKHHKNYKVYIL